MSNRGPPDRKLIQHLSSVENVHRTLSLAIDLSTVYGRENLPNRLEMYKFVHKQIGVKAEELEDIQNHPFLPQVYVKVKTEVTLIRGPEFSDVLPIKGVRINLESGALDHSAILTVIIKLAKILHHIGMQHKPFKLEHCIFPLNQNFLAERSFDLRTSGLWAQHASTAPLCYL